MSSCRHHYHLDSEVLFLQSVVQHPYHLDSEVQFLQSVVLHLSTTWTQKYSSSTTSTTWTQKYSSSSLWLNVANASGQRYCGVSNALTSFLRPSTSNHRQYLHATQINQKKTKVKHKQLFTTLGASVIQLNAGANGLRERDRRLPSHANPSHHH